MRAIATAVAALCAACATPALAHHSRANFDFNRAIEIEGVVIEYAWRNPHAFAVIATIDETGEKEEWTFEMNSTPVLTRLGVSKDSLKPGDHVVAHAYRDRDPARRFAYADVFIKDDGAQVRSGTGPGVFSPPRPEEFAGSTDFTGAWMIALPTSFDILTGGLPTTELITDLPVNDKGQALVEAFDASANPELDCQPMSIPTILRYPYPFKIVRDDEATLRFVYEVNRLERVIHLDIDEHPSYVPRSSYGHSIGWFEDDGALVVETARFSHVRWGAGDGVDSSERKRTREVYRLADEGRTLALTFTLEDPEYLREPAILEHRYSLVPGYELQDYTCDPETARRHLTAGL